MANLVNYPITGIVGSSQVVGRGTIVQIEPVAPGGGSVPSSGQRFPRGQG